MHRLVLLLLLCSASLTVMGMDFSPASFYTAPDQSLRGEITLRSARPGALKRLHDLHIQLAAPKHFAAYGMAYPQLPEGLHIDVAYTPDGQPYIRIELHGGFRDASPALLLRLSWRGGRLFYPVRLDFSPAALRKTAPPGYLLDTALWEHPTPPIRHAEHATQHHAPASTHQPRDKHTTHPLPAAKKHHGNTRTATKQLPLPVKPGLQNKKPSSAPLPTAKATASTKTHKLPETPGQKKTARLALQQSKGEATANSTATQPNSRQNAPLPVPHRTAHNSASVSIDPAPASAIRHLLPGLLVAAVVCVGLLILLWWRWNKTSVRQVSHTEKARQNRQVRDETRVTLSDNGTQPVPDGSMTPTPSKQKAEQQEQVQPQQEESLLDQATELIREKRWRRAKRLLQRAVQQHPHDIELKLQLLEVLSTLKNPKHFITQAEALFHDLQEDVNHPLWQTVVVMGAGMAPKHHLFQSPRPAEPNAPVEDTHAATADKREKDNPPAASSPVLESTSDLSENDLDDLLADQEDDMPESQDQTAAPRPTEYSVPNDGASSADTARGGQEAAWSIDDPDNLFDLAFAYRESGDLAASQRILHMLLTYDDAETQGRAQTLLQDPEQLTTTGNTEPEPPLRSPPALDDAPRSTNEAPNLPASVTHADPTTPHHDASKTVISHEQDTATTTTDQTLAQQLSQLLTLTSEPDDRSASMIAIQNDGDAVLATQLSELLKAGLAASPISGTDHILAKQLSQLAQLKTKTVSDNTTDNAGDNILAQQLAELANIGRPRLADARDHGLAPSSQH